MKAPSTLRSVYTRRVLKLDEIGHLAAAWQIANPLPDDEACSNPEFVWLESLRTNSPQVEVDRTYTGRSLCTN